MANTLGQRISMLRKEKGVTQEAMAEKLGVSPQAVSKWENDISCPDIALLPALARLLDVTIDRLLDNEVRKEVTIMPKENRKNFDDMVLKVIVNSTDGDKVNINIPMVLVKVAMEMGIALPQISANEALKNINIDQIIQLVENGVIGKLVEVVSADGDTVDIVVE